MNVDELTLEELRALGWDGYSWTLEDFKLRLKAALDLGWDPNEMSLDEFESQEEKEELSEDERRDRAEQEGWDEEEMDLDEFVIPYRKKTVAFEVFSEIVADRILIQPLALDEQLRVIPVISHIHIRLSSVSYYYLSAYYLSGGPLLWPSRIPPSAGVPCTGYGHPPV